MCKKICQVNNCGRLAIAKGYCDKHYRRVRRHGKPITIQLPRGLQCCVEGCLKPVRARLLCHMHYQRLYLTGSLELKKRPTDYERFCSRIVKSDDDKCWGWRGAVHPFGYGVFTINRKNIAAHRASWQFFCGEIPPELHVLHRCDNPPCCNPNHLFLGTAKDNIRDCVQKGRYKSNSKRGEEHNAAKLTTKDVLTIRKAIKDGVSQSSLARKYKISLGCIWAIKIRKTWAHLKEHQ